MFRFGWKPGDNESLSIWNGSFAMAGMSIVNNYVAMYLLDGLHATDNEMGYLNSLPSLVNLFAMTAAAIALQRTNSKRLFCVTATTISRSFYLYMAIIPWLPIAHPALWVVWLVALTRLPQSFGDLSWQTLISDLIRTERRSAFFSERSRVLTILGLIVTLGTGFILQQFPKSAVLPYQALFLCTAAFAVMEIWLLYLHDDSAIPARTKVGLMERLNMRYVLRAARSVFQHKRFLYVSVALLVFNFGWQLAWPLFNIYQISTAHATATWFGLFAVGSQATQILTFRWWGRMADRIGNARLIAWAAAGMALAPVLTILSTNMWIILAVNMLSGIPLAGLNLLLFNYLLEVCPEGEKATYIGLYNIALAVVGFVAPECGIWLLHTAGMTFGMLTSTGLRALGALLFLIIGVVGYRLTAERQNTRMTGV